MSGNAWGNEIASVAYGLNKLIEVVVTGDDALEVAEFMEDGGEEVVATVGFGVGGSDGGVFSILNCVSAAPPQEAF